MARCTHPFAALAFTPLVVVCTRCDEQVKEIACAHPWDSLDLTDWRKPHCTLCKQALPAKRMFPMPPRALTEVVRKFLQLVQADESGMQVDPRAETRYLLAMADCVHAIDTYVDVITPADNSAAAGQRQQTTRQRGR